MNRILKLVVALYLSVMSSATAQNRVDPWLHGQNTDPSQQSNNCAVSDAGNMTYFEGADTYNIFEDVRNNASSQKSGIDARRQGAQKRYVFEPNFNIKSVKAIPLSKKNSRVEIVLTPSYPSRETVQDFIKQNGNPDVKLGNINPLCVLAYSFSLPDAVSDFTILTPGGATLTRDITGRFTLEAKTSTRVVEELQNGGSLKFGYTKLIKLSRLQRVEITLRDIKKSRVYRDFISPVEGRLVSAFQAYQAAAAINNETNVHFYREGKTDEDYQRIIEPMLQTLFDVARQEIIPFEDVSKKLVNFEGQRFSTDVTRRIAYDSKNLTKNDWCNKYKNSFQRELDTFDESKGSGGGGFSFLKYISLNGKGSKESKQSVKNHLKQLLETEDCGKNAFENTFKYEWDGEKYEPKGIIAFEVVALSTRSDVDKRVSEYYVDQTLANTVVDVRRK